MDGHCWEGEPCLTLYTSCSNNLIKFSFIELFVKLGYFIVILIDLNGCACKMAILCLPVLLEAARGACAISKDGCNETLPFPPSPIVLLPQRFRFGKDSSKTRLQGKSIQ